MEKKNNVQDVIEMLQRLQKIIQNISGTAYAVQSAVNPLREMQDRISGGLRLYYENPAGKIIGSLKMYDRNLFKGIPTIPDPMAPIRKSISASNRINRLCQTHLAATAASWQLLNLSLWNALPRMNIREQTAFGNFNAALSGISGEFLKSMSYAQTWQDAAIVETTNSIITETLDEVYGDKNAPAEDTTLDRFWESLLTELSKFLSRTTCCRAKEYLLKLISITSAILSIYSVCTAPGKEDITDIIRAELRSSLEIQEQEIDQIVGKYLAKIRTARIDTPLKYAAAKNARNLGTVKQGQQVTVVETRHKYLLVTYIDMRTQEPKSGFVLKKHFQ